ncbi:MAG: CoA transferase [Ilumatobacter sp.]
MALSIEGPGDLSTPSGDHIELVGADVVSASAFDVDGLIVETAHHAIASIDSFGSTRGLSPLRRTLDREHLLAYSTTFVEVDDAPVPAWAELSGVYPTAGGRHLQIHCNFDHHADGVVARLGCSADRDAVAAAIAERDAFELEAELIADGMIGAAVRTIDEWNAHPHRHATSGLPVMSVEQLGDAPAMPAAPPSDRPLAGVRVLDCSRVLAGPVAGQLLADAGADVLRIGADHLPSIPVGVMSTGFGKRNTSIDLRTSAGCEVFADLVAGADVLIDAFRPGALAGQGFDLERLTAIRPSIVVVQISAFDWVGPWAGRRGFDSIVQSTTGVRWAGGRFANGRTEPVGLPVQALDYATGFVAAGMAAQLLEHQRRVGGSWLGRTSLLRMRDRLVRRREPQPYVPAAVEVDPRFLQETDSAFGRLRTVRSFAAASAAAPMPLGSSPAAWNR